MGTASPSEAISVPRFCDWCGAAIDDRRPQARFCSGACRAEAYRAKPCTYCGMPAQSTDHFLPTVYVKMLEDVRPTSGQRLLPACLECNTIAGANVFKTVPEKRRFVHQQLRKRYRKVLRMPEWTEQELDELGHSLRSHVVRGLALRDQIRARLKWRGA